MFVNDRDLLNAKFEGYRLDLIPQDQVVSRVTLRYKPTQATASGKVPLTFQEMQSRITHNHLALSPSGGRAIYVDADFKVILVDLGTDMLSPSFSVIFELPSPISSFDIVAQREYPSAIFLSDQTVFVADGCGAMYIFSIKDEQTSPTDSIAAYTLSVSSVTTPFRIHYVHRTSPTTATAVLSSRYYSPNGPARTPGKHGPIYFDVWAVKIDLLSSKPSQNEFRQMDMIWHRRGQDVPIYVVYDDSLYCYLLIGGSMYSDPNNPQANAFEPSPDEFAPIPRGEEDLDSAMKVDPASKPPPYSWTQTPDSVTVAFPLPSDTPKSKIRVSFSPRTVTVHIDSDAAFIPRLSAKSLWDGISTSSSFWTWDREAEHRYGLLTLHLEKQNEGTRWMHVFASAGTKPSSSSEAEDMDVPETLDPSELWEIRESLEKYTQSLLKGKDSTGLGLGTGIPSLAAGEMDEDVDTTVGRTCSLTWVGEDGSAPPWWKSEEMASFQLLSTPMPGISDNSIIIKNNLDGLVFAPLPSAGQEPPKWTHISTFSALSFVLASKQDTRFTYHIPKKAVFAFEGGIRDRGGNVYIYRASPIKEKWAKQAVLKVDDGRGGSLLGVGSLGRPDGTIIIVCLTEGELVLIKDM